MGEKPSLMHGVCLCLGYDGTDFHGWQAQPGLRTVQGMVEEAIDEMGIEHSQVRGCSRTDAGVHALGQIASFAAAIEVPREGWISGLNARLPEDIVIHDARACYRRYNPRFHAAHKRYRYLIRCGPRRDPMIRRQAWQLGPSGMRKDVGTRGVRVEDYLDVDAMHTAAAFFVGEHDFRAFRQSGDQREIVVREMFEVSLFPGWGGRPDLLAVEVVGNSFMKNMVRIMVGTLVDIGRGRLMPDAVPAMLDEGADRSDAGQTAPAHGLTLVEIALGRFDGPGDAFDRPTEAEPPCRS
ncbi:MAG TPA: tRNA pseudouridine(38-40) synthase TruA [Polyangiales bacterium]|nr:tRNA pseudouridine(38-40) synthase TruA [Polyangiales bacterium]